MQYANYVCCCAAPYLTNVKMQCFVVNELLWFFNSRIYFNFSLDLIVKVEFLKYEFLTLHTISNGSFILNHKTQYSERREKKLMWGEKIK